jgi:hypothetical protein
LNVLSGSCFADCFEIIFGVFSVFGLTSIGLTVALFTRPFGRASSFRAVFLGAAIFLILVEFKTFFLGGFSLNLKTGSAAFFVASAFAALGRLARVGPIGRLFDFVTFIPASKDSILCGDGGKME